MHKIKICEPCPYERVKGEKNLWIDKEKYFFFSANNVPPFLTVIFIYLRGLNLSRTASVRRQCFSVFLSDSKIFPVLLPTSGTQKKKEHKFTMNTGGYPGYPPQQGGYPPQPGQPGYGMLLKQPGVEFCVTQFIDGCRGDW